MDIFSSLKLSLWESPGLKRELGPHLVFQSCCCSNSNQWNQWGNVHMKLSTSASVGWIRPPQGWEIISIFSYWAWNLTLRFWESCRRETNFHLIRFKMHFWLICRLKITSELAATLCCQCGFWMCVFTIYKSLFSSPLRNLLLIPFPFLITIPFP